MRRLTCSIDISGLYVTANPAFLHAWGYSFDELRHAPAGALMHPGERLEAIEPEVQALFRKIRDEGGSGTFKSWGRAKGGHRIDYCGWVTWVEPHQRWDLVLEVDEEMPIPQYPDPADHIPMIQWQLNRQALQLRAMQQALERTQSAPPPVEASKKPHTPRHHADREPFLAQLRSILLPKGIPLDRWEVNIDRVRKGLTPPVNDRTLRNTLDYHGLLIEGSPKNSLVALWRMFAAEAGLTLPED
jgi:hypothetical protein